MRADKLVCFEVIGNIISFVLLGLFLIYPFDYLQIGRFPEAEFTLSGYTIIFFLYGLIYGVIRLILKRKINKGQRLSELQQSDELERGITLKATKIAYQTAMTTLILSVVFISYYNALVSWGVHFIFTTQQFAVMCLAGSLIIIQLAYLMIWLKEYKKII